MQKPLLILIGLVCSASFCQQAEAQLFQRARETRQARLYDKGQASLDHVPFTRMGRAIKARGDARVYRIAERKGVSPQLVRGRRLQALEAFGEGLAGAASGLSAAADSIGASTPNYPVRRTGSTLPANFSQQMWWRNYNRNYAHLPHTRGASEPY